MILTYEEKNIWWDAYCSALSGMHAYGQAGESYTIEGADGAAAKAADLALARWRAILVQDERSIPSHCEGCAHEAKDAYQEPCASCSSGSGRGDDRREVGNGG